MKIKNQKGECASSARVGRKGTLFSKPGEEGLS